MYKNLLCKTVTNMNIVIFQIGFIMKYDYRNMTATLQSESKEPEVTWLQHHVYVNLGQITKDQ